MVLEVALFDVTDPDEFEKAYLGAHHLITSTEGCRSLRMTRGVETPGRFVLLVEWDSVEVHERNFRQTDAWREWRAAVGPWFANPPRVEHFTDVV
jgi:quinol monooxygenase YgiN